MIGAPPPIILPQKFIHPVMVPVNLPAEMSVQVVHDEFMGNPRKKSANVNQITVVHLPSATAVKYSARQQSSSPDAPNQARTLDPTIFLPIRRSLMTPHSSVTERKTEFGHRRGKAHLFQRKMVGFEQSTPGARR